MLDAIAARRSIRKFKNTPVPRHIIEEIIKAGALAPSSKNRQPWHFVVTTGKAKEEALAAMEQGLHRETQQPFLPESAQYIAGAWNTLAIMRQAPIIIFVVNPLGLDLLTPQNAENRVFEICNAQSIGAAVENMSLAAVEAGLGSLWICDTILRNRSCAHGWAASLPQLLHWATLMKNLPRVRANRGVRRWSGASKLFKIKGLFYELY